MKLVPAHWSTDIIQNDQGDEKFLGVDDEPGFDLSDEEIRKLKLWPQGVIPYYIDVISFNGSYYIKKVFVTYVYLKQQQP